ncbi:hypothetical protein [Enterobacter bugandensis]
MKRTVLTPALSATALLIAMQAAHADFMNGWTEDAARFTSLRRRLPRKA